MKKLIALSTFIVLGFAAAYAQTPSKASTTPASMAPVTSMQVAAPVTEVAEVKKEAKKECSTEEKKSCGSKAGKKSCCSEKSEAKKEGK